jgi:hypothetical protein
MVRDADGVLFACGEEDADADADVDAEAACWCPRADDNEAPPMAPVADVDTFCTPEWARKAARKFEKKGRELVDMLKA